MKYQAAAAITKATRMIHHQSARPPVAGAAGAGAPGAVAGGVVCASAADTTKNIEETAVANGMRMVFPSATDPVYRNAAT